MKERLENPLFDISLHNRNITAQNPLIAALTEVFTRAGVFREKARKFYFQVLLSQYRCPECGGTLRMTGPSECTCSCGNIFDPTLTFQKSQCCSTRLIRKTCHYACCRCNKTVPSRFLFDEQIFDKAYFREVMRESRERAKRKKEEIRRLLAESRSEDLHFMQTPDLDSIPGMVRDLDEFIHEGSIGIGQFNFEVFPRFSMEEYQEHISSILSWDSILFSDITPLIDNDREDKIWRFVTLVFMENDREVELTQDGNDLWVQKVYHEAYG